jgi:beta-glucosidase
VARPFSESRWVYLLIVLAVVLCQPERVPAQAEPTHSGSTNIAASPLKDAQVQDRANRLLRQMTLEQKVAQLSQLPGFPIPEFEKTVNKTPEEVIRQFGAGSVLWVSDPKEINRLQKVAVEQSPLHIPLLFGLDVINGYRTIFPAPIAMASSWDTKLVEAAQSVAAREARAAGIQWTFGPMLDIARDARWGRMVEGAGEDPYLGAAMARAQVLGFQGQRLGAPDHVLACVKHFAGYGAAEGGRDYDSAYISEDQLWNVYLPPFKAALDAGTGSVMSAYMDLNDVPASGNRWLLHDVLRETWGFKGFVVSDAVAVRSLVTHGFARDLQDATYKAFSAGVDMDMASGTYLKYLASEQEHGRISMQQVDDSVRAILETKIRLGLFEHPYVDESHVESVLSDPEHQRLARRTAQRSVVLLRNENSLLPLGKNIRSIAVIACGVP